VPLVSPHSRTNKAPLISPAPQVTVGRTPVSRRPSIRTRAFRAPADPAPQYDHRCIESAPHPAAWRLLPTGTGRALSTATGLQMPTPQGRLAIRRCALETSASHGAKGRSARRRSRLHLVLKVGIAFSSGELSSPSPRVDCFERLLIPRERPARRARGKIKALSTNVVLLPSERAFAILFLVTESGRSQADHAVPVTNTVEIRFRSVHFQSPS
jgi:hypothetical protein